MSQATANVFRRRQPSPPATSGRTLEGGSLSTFTAYNPSVMLPAASVTRTATRAGPDATARVERRGATEWETQGAGLEKSQANELGADCVPSAAVTDEMPLLSLAATRISWLPLTHLPDTSAPLTAIAGRVGSSTVTATDCV